MLADELGGLAWARLTGQAGVLQWLRLEQALPLRASTCDRVTVDAAGGSSAWKRPTRAWPD